MGRKRHNGEAGYIAERMNPYAADTKVVIYKAIEQGYGEFDEVEGKYVVECKAHGQISFTTSVPKARALMKRPDRFCGDCERPFRKAKKAGEKTPPAPARCYCGCGNLVKKGEFFATNSCGRAYAEELIAGNEQRWCPGCEGWHNGDKLAGLPDFCAECGTMFTVLGRWEAAA